MTQKCKYPNCHQAATNIWALVPLCPDHFQGVVEETERYYNNNLRNRTMFERKIYNEIQPLTPWGKKGKR
ncbi:hypothetical protein V7114_20825 [Neobacillus niacini]|uniref:hypothetical protein n=1 Tax=Neobacillus niacini TaxID=86668 RepID=UPI002FFE34B0